MRPVSRGLSPSKTDFHPYEKAKPFLISRLGGYCSYCERYINTILAVEHIQPKGGSHAHPHLIGVWTNYLLACTNCNSTKKDKEIVLADVLLPDRDNTFVAFSYSKDGRVHPSQTAISMGLETKAKHTLALTGLDKKINSVFDENGKQIAIDRVSQRLEVWAVAEESKSDIDADPNSNALRKSVIRTAVAYGFFSIWLTVFEKDTDMYNRLIDAFHGTRNSGCFDNNAKTISPAPNPDQLPNGSKI